MVIDSWYASGGKKFFLQDKFKLNSVFRRGGRYYYLVSPPSGLRDKSYQTTPGFTRGHHGVASSRHLVPLLNFNLKKTKITIPMR